MKPPRIIASAVRREPFPWRTVLLGAGAALLGGAALALVQRELEPSGRALGGVPYRALPLLAFGGVLGYGLDFARGREGWRGALLGGLGFAAGGIVAALVTRTGVRPELPAWAVAGAAGGVGLAMTLHAGARARALLAAVATIIFGVAMAYAPPSMPPTGG